MRQIKFRARTYDNDTSDGWVYSTTHGLSDFFHGIEEGRYDEDTLGEFTGLRDSKDVEIYEGDIVKSGKEYNSYTGLNSDLYGGNKYVVENNGWRFYLKEPSLYIVDLTDLEAIGNVHETPELLSE